eukprot:8640761-Karenia_brevis.AAC.1
MDISVDVGIQYEPDMVAEPALTRKRSDEELAGVVTMVVQSTLPQLQQQNSSSIGEKEESDEKKKRVVLDEKHFRRMDRFTGE